MKFSELREGNIVDQNGVIAPVNAYQIYQFSLFQMGLMDKGDQYDFYAGWKPVELTRDLINKTGSELINLSKFDSFVQEEVGFYDDEDGFFFVLDSYQNDHGIVIYVEKKVETMHLLQNLVFVLTGQELDTTKISEG